MMTMRRTAISEWAQAATLRPAPASAALTAFSAVPTSTPLACAVSLACSPISSARRSASPCPPCSAAWSRSACRGV
jgi:hypothetical protein